MPFQIVCNVNVNPTKNKNLDLNLFKRTALLLLQQLIYGVYIIVSLFFISHYYINLYRRRRCLIHRGAVLLYSTLIKPIDDLPQQ